jgi:hypothetical protein
MRKSLFLYKRKRGPSPATVRGGGSKFPGAASSTHVPLHTPTRNRRSVSHPIAIVVCIGSIERNCSHKGKPHQRKCEQRKWHAHRHVKSHSTRSTIHVRPPSASRHGPALSQHSTLVHAVVLKLLDLYDVLFHHRFVFTALACVLFHHRFVFFFRASHRCTHPTAPGGARS